MMDRYFHSLASKTGAQEFIIVRDDYVLKSQSCPVLNCGPNGLDRTLQSSSCLSPSTTTTRIIFQQSEPEHQPLCPPKRMGSDENVRNPRKSRDLEQRYNRWVASASSSEIRDRLKDLFGEEVTKSVVTSSSKHKVGNSTEESQEGLTKSLLSNLDAPKFPIRKGSHDDLSTLKKHRRRRRNLTAKSKEKKLDIFHLIDEVGLVLSEEPAPSDGVRRNSIDSQTLLAEDDFAPTNQNARWGNPERVTRSLDELPSNF